MLLAPKISISDVLSLGFATFMVGLTSVTVPGLLATTYNNIKAEQLFQDGLKAFYNRDFNSASLLWEKTYLYQKANPSQLLRLSETTNNLGVALEKQGLDNKACEKLKESIEIRKRFYNDDLVATSLYHLGKISLKHGNVRMAKTYISESASLFAKNLGNSAPDTIRAQRLLASLG